MSRKLMSLSVVLILVAGIVCLWVRVEQLESRITELEVAANDTTVAEGVLTLIESAENHSDGLLQLSESLNDTDRKVQSLSNNVHNSLLPRMTDVEHQVELLDSAVDFLYLVLGETP